MPPSFPHLSDEYEPTNATLWDKVLDVARGDAEELTIGDRTIHKPDGFVWPSPPASAWAVKQYKGFGGNWKRKASVDIYQQRALRVLQAGGVVTSSTAEEHGWMTQLQDRGLARQVHASDDRQLWEKTAGLADELTRRIDRVLAGNHTKESLAELGEWVDKNFRVNSAKTPKGMKRLKGDTQKLIKMLKLLGDPNARGSEGHVEGFVENSWKWVKPQLDDLVLYFSAEGDAAKGRKPVLTELKLSTGTFLNRANMSNARFEKYAKGVNHVLASLKGWRKKALSGNLKVAFVGAQEMRSQGKYKQAEDTLLVRGTPKVLKRSAGYGTADYIIVHELGHRYERFHGTGKVNFDRPKWYTTRYSQTEGFGGSESFAELFALGHFRLTGNWDPTILDRFEAVMVGKSEE
jgi:hypothetical protein